MYLVNTKKMQKETKNIYLKYFPRSPDIIKCKPTEPKQSKSCSGIFSRPINAKLPNQKHPNDLEYANDFDPTSKKENLA